MGRKRYLEGDLRGRLGLIDSAATASAARGHNTRLRFQTRPSVSARLLALVRPVRRFDLRRPRNNDGLRRRYTVLSHFALSTSASVLIPAINNTAPLSAIISYFLFPRESLSYISTVQEKWANTFFFLSTMINFHFSIVLSGLFSLLNKIK